MKNCQHHNSLNISKFQMGGGKKRPLIFCFLALLASLICVYTGYRAGLRTLSENTTEPIPELSPVAIPPSIVCNRDSMLYYYEKGFLENDPKGLFFVAVGYYCRREGMLPDTIPAVTRETAEHFLVLSAEKGFRPAIQLVEYLQYYEDFPYELK